MMKHPRVLGLPYVTMPRDPETVVFRVPLGPDTYYEITLLPDEGEGLGFALQLDARRARDTLATNARLAKKR